MYIPAAFAQTDLVKLHAFIEQNSFGTLVSQVEGQPLERRRKVVEVLKCQDDENALAIAGAMQSMLPADS